MTTETIDQAATVAAPEPTDAESAIPPSVAAIMAESDAARAKVRALEERFRATVHPDIWKMHVEIDELEAEARFESMMLHVEELCRHLPGLAPALRLTWTHIIDTRTENVGRCCTTWPIEP